MLRASEIMGKSRTWVYQQIGEIRAVFESNGFSRRSHELSIYVRPDGDGSPEGGLARREARLEKALQDGGRVRDCKRSEIQVPGLILALEGHQPSPDNASGPGWSGSFCRISRICRSTAGSTKPRFCAHSAHVN